MAKVGREKQKDTDSETNLYQNIESSPLHFRDGNNSLTVDKGSANLHLKGR